MTGPNEFPFEKYAEANGLGWELNLRESCCMRSANSVSITVRVRATGRTAKCVTSTRKRGALKKIWSKWRSPLNRIYLLWSPHAVGIVHKFANSQHTNVTYSYGQQSNQPMVDCYLIGREDIFHDMKWTTSTTTALQMFRISRTATEPNQQIAAVCGLCVTVQNAT